MTPQPPTAGDQIPMHIPTVDIVIVNWNTGHYLRNCIQSLVVAQRNGWRLGHVIVVDNASSDGSTQDLPRLAAPLTVVVNRSNVGFAAACNQGAALGSGDYVLFLNPDTQVFPSALSAAVAFLENCAGSRIGICGAQVVNASGNPASSFARFPTLRGITGRMTGLDQVAPRLFPRHQFDDQKTSGPVDQVIGAFFFVRRPLFQKLFGFDEGYFLYYEEVDFSLRARQLGWISYHLREAVVFHAENISSEQVVAARLFHSLRSRTEFAYRHWSWAARITLIVLNVMVEFPARCIRAAASRDWEQFRDARAAYIRYLRYLARHNHTQNATLFP